MRLRIYSLWSCIRFSARSSNMPDIRGPEMPKSDYIGERFSLARDASSFRRCWGKVHAEIAHWDEAGWDDPSIAMDRVTALCSVLMCSWEFWTARQAYLEQALSVACPGGIVPPSLVAFFSQFGLPVRH